MQNKNSDKNSDKPSVITSGKFKVSKVQKSAKLPRLFLSLSILAAITVGTLASAQDLVKLLPSDSLLALGAVNLNEIEERGSDFIDEFNRLNIFEAISSVSGEDISQEDLDTAMESFDAMALLGQEAWLSVSPSTESLIPAIIAIARPTSESLSELSALITEETATCDNGESYYLAPVEDMDSPVSSVSFAIKDGVVLLSTEAGRTCSILGAMSGANYSSLTSNARYKDSLGQLGEGNLYSFFDTSVVANTYAPLGMGQGFDDLIARVQQALTTAGLSAGIARFTDDGMVSEGWQILDNSGGDKSIYKLLSDATPVSTNSLNFAPVDSLGYNNSATNLRGWWAYINELAREVPALGGNLDSLIEIFVGIDVSESLFSWMGTSVTTITTGISEVTEPGAPSENLLGDTVYIVEAKDEAKAQKGLQEVFDAVSIALAMFGDPTGGMGNASSSEQMIAGQSVASFNITTGVSMHYAVVGGHALIATSLDSMTAALETYAGGPSLASNLNYAELISSMPENVKSLDVTDLSSTMQGSAGQLTSQLNAMAGLGGASTLDFDAVESSSASLTEFTEFIASRLGYSVGYTQTKAEGIYSYSKTQIQW